MAKRTTKPRAFIWSTHQRYQHSPCGCGKTAIWTEASNAYRVVWFRDQKDRPYLAQRYRADWPRRNNWGVVSRQSSLRPAPLACEQHGAIDEPENVEQEQFNAEGDRIPPR